MKIIFKKAFSPITKILLTGLFLVSSMNSFAAEDSAKTDDHSIASINSPEMVPWEQLAKGSTQPTFPMTPKNSTNNDNNNLTSHVLVFVSSSMPTTSLAQWVSQANAIHATVFVRGFVNDSLPDTKNWIKNVLEQLPDKKGGMAIDPVVFETYHIQQVPAVVVTKELSHCTNEPCAIPHFDVVYGNTSLHSSLETIVKANGETSQLAQQYLNDSSVGSTL